MGSCGQKGHLGRGWGVVEKWGDIGRTEPSLYPDGMYNCARQLKTEFDLLMVGPKVIVPMKPDSQCCSFS